MNPSEVIDEPYWIAITKERLLALGLHPIQFEASVTLLGLIEFDDVPPPTVGVTLVRIPNRARVLRTSVLSWLSSRTWDYRGIFLIPYHWDEDLHVEINLFVRNRPLWSGCPTDVATVRSMVKFVYAEGFQPVG